MKKIDRWIRWHMDAERVDIPRTVHDAVERTLNSLPERTKRRMPGCIRFRIAAVTVGFLGLTLFLLPNISVSYVALTQTLTANSRRSSFSRRMVR